MSRLKSAWCLLGCLAMVAGCGDDDGGGGTGGGDAAIPIDGAPPCDSDEDCADGVYCNGEEICAQGQCVFGPRRNCDDGVLCTDDTCSEVSQACRHTPTDLDNDGHASIACVDNAGDPLGDDCDDERADRYPGNREVCDPDNVDEDCDDSTYGSLDQDNDGHDSDRCCNPSPTNANDLTCGTDCDDLRASTRPDATEICDQLDNDCDGAQDEGVAVMQYVDADRDGHGLEGSTAVPVCASSVGFSPDDIDCDDTKPTVHGAQLEICDNGVDNDCDEAVDEEENVVAWYVDADSDGFGDPSQPAIASCAPPAGRSILGTDCDDSNAAINPGAAEACDAVDNDCNGLADFAIEPGNLEDDDGDGSADAECVGGPDCDDNDPNTGSGFEICDGYDNDCDEKVDEEVPNTVWYLDLDGDGFGDTSAPAVVLCAPISGRTPFGGDCNDRSAAAYPGAKEVCNGRDDNCDGVIDGTFELIEAGCVGQSVLVSGTVFGPPSTAPARVAGAIVTIVHHTGVEVATAMTNATGAFNVRVPRGTVFVIVEPPDNLAAGLVGSAIAVNGPRSDLEIALLTPADLAGLAPTALAESGVVIASIVGASPAGGQGIAIDPIIPGSARARLGLASVAGTTLPPITAGTPGDALPFAMVSFVDAAPGAYVIAPLDAANCEFREGNFFDNTVPIEPARWPVRANVITWVSVDCSGPIAASCCDPCSGACSDPDIVACVADNYDSFCGTAWNSNCAAIAVNGCTTCPAVSSCFGAHPAPGCEDPALAASVCAVIDEGPFDYTTCCSQTWSRSCATEAVRQVTNQTCG